MCWGVKCVCAEYCIAPNACDRIWHNCNFNHLAVNNIYNANWRFSGDSNAITVHNLLPVNASKRFCSVCKRSSIQTKWMDTMQAGYANKQSDIQTYILHYCNNITQSWSLQIKWNSRKFCRKPYFNPIIATNEWVCRWRWHWFSITFKISCLHLRNPKNVPPHINRTGHMMDKKEYQPLQLQAFRM